MKVILTQYLDDCMNCAAASGFDGTCEADAEHRDYNPNDIPDWCPGRQDTEKTVFACDALGDLYQHNAQLLLVNKELLARCDLLNAELAALKEGVCKVVEMHRKGVGHVCTHYPSGRRALDALAALVGEG